MFCDSATTRAFPKERGDLPMNMLLPLYPPNPYPATLNVYFPAPSPHAQVPYTQPERAHFLVSYFIQGKELPK